MVQWGEGDTVPGIYCFPFSTDARKTGCFNNIDHIDWWMHTRTLLTVMTIPIGNSTEYYVDFLFLQPRYVAN